MNIHCKLGFKFFLKSEMRLKTLHEWKGEGWDNEHGEYKMDITGTFRKESREFEGGGAWGGLMGLEKIEDLDGGR